MKRTIKCLGMAFGPAVLIPLVVACSPRPAQAPPGAPTAPVESGTPSGQQQPGAEMPGQAPAPTGPTGQLGMPEQQIGPQGQQPQQGLGSGIGEQGQPAQPSEAAPINERELCDSLAAQGRMRVEDVQNGVAIVITPKAGQNLATVRDDARRLESSIRMGAGGEGVVGAPQRGVRSGETCGIAELGRLPSVSTQLTESGNSVRIVMTTSNANEVRDLRRITRDEVNALIKGQQQRPGQQQQQQQPGMQQGQQEP